MLLLLIGGSIIYLLLGSWREAAVLIVFANFSVVVTIVQQARSERALEALRDLSSPRALVVRGGVRRRIAGRDVVHGDLVVLNEGDRVPADGWVLAGDALLLDESLLTGEAVPVAKRPGIPGAPPRPGGEGLAYVFSGTLIVRGTGMCRVAATGVDSEMGRIGRALMTIEPRAPTLTRQTRRLVVLFAVVGALASIAAILLYGLTRGSWLQGALVGIALGMALLPEEFPVVLAIFLAMGALRMSRVRVLVRRADAIVALGTASVLCTDKTGTLTENRMRVAELRLPDGRILAPTAADARSLRETAARASVPTSLDPMEVAILALAPVAAAGTLVRHYPLTADLLAVTQVWQRDGRQSAATKGAPEAIAGLCHLPGGQHAALHAAVAAMGAAGLRVLGVAEAEWPGPALPDDPRAFAFRWSGLVGLHDPLRASVPDAIRACHAAGIRVVMITGDHPETAAAIARDAGIPHDRAAVVTGAQIATMTDRDLAVRLPDMAVFARIQPEQKLRIVQALKAAGAVVGMTGDGVNDAPSLKAADIGIAMGGRGTDVAREASSIALLDDDFGSIVDGVAMGRRITDNIRNAMAFIVAVHVPIAGLALMPLLLGTPVLLAPIHIALLEMLIDPVCSLVFEAETPEADTMTRPPRPVDHPLLSRGLLAWAGMQGATVLIATAAVALSIGGDAAEMRTTAFLTLVLCVIALVLTNRSFSASLVTAVIRPNLGLRIVLAVVAAIFALSEFVPVVRATLDFAEIGWRDIGVAAATATAVMLLIEGAKRQLGARLFD